ncbi:hypothetical protein NIES4074_53180 [Cylindrospermum sp. NIES-4074]|nr:hypothetical protein NIES4074_53180 [Cylindrospermum sp. NIES-4074]
MRINPEEIARHLRQLNQTPEQRVLEELHLLELDEFEVEPLAIHWEELCSLGIHWESYRVQETMNAYSSNLEGAILYVIDFNYRIGFDDTNHATNTFLLALREDLKPKKMFEKYQN